MFGRLFGSNKSKQSKPTSDLNTSIQQVRSAVEQLEKREAHLENKIQQCLKTAKEKSKRKDKRGAMFELKKKKQLESQLQSLQGKKIEFRNSNHDFGGCSSECTNIDSNENVRKCYRNNSKTI